MISWVVFFISLAVISFLLAPWIAERMRTPMDDQEARTKAPGEFAELPSGTTHYRWFGPEGGPIAVCVHGASTPSFAYVGLATALSMKGWRVLTYDLYGRGFSDNTQGAQSADYFLKQLEELLENQGITGSFTLIGYSMGGLIGAAYTAQKCERVERLILIGAAGLGKPNLDASGIIFFRKIPYLERWVGMLFGGRVLRKYIRNEIGADPVRARQLEQTRRRGYWPALISSQQNILDADFLEVHRTIAMAETPVLAIWGKLDEVIPLDSLGNLAQINRAARQEVLEDANHGLTYSHPKEIAEIILNVS